MAWRESSPRRSTRRPVSLNLEILEDRTTPSTSPLTAANAGPGVFDSSSATWYLRGETSAGAPDAGSFKYGMAGWLPIVGDWTGTGQAGIGVVDPTTNTWYLRNELSAGAPDAGQFQFGAPGWIPVVGDWTSTGHVGIGVVDPATNTWYLRNEVSAGAPDAGIFKYGAPGWTPVAGDWTGAGHAGLGVVDTNTNTWYLRTEVSAGAPDAGKFAYGAPGWKPVAGDWTGAGHTGIGVVDPASNTWYLRTEISAGAPDAGQFQYGAPGTLPVAGRFTPASSSSPATQGSPLLTLNLNPLDLNLLGLEVQTNQITVTVSAQKGNGQLLGNLLTDVSGLLNLSGVNSALNNVLGSVVQLLNSTSLIVNGVNSTSGPLSSAATSTTPVLDLFVAPVHLNVLGALVDTSPIHLTITAHAGQGLVLGNVISDLANLFNPPLPTTFNLDTVNAALQNLLSELNAQIPGIGSASSPPVTIPAGSDQILSLIVAPINVNLLGLVLQTSQIQVNANAVTGNGNLLGNVLTDLLNVVGATPQNLGALNNNLNALLAKVIGVLNASSLILPTNALNSLTSVLQTLATPNLVNASGTASAPILNLSIASTDGKTPPVDVNLLGLVVTTSNIQAQLIAQTGSGQVLGNLLYNTANLLNPGGSLNLLTILNELSL